MEYYFENTNVITASEFLADSSDTLVWKIDYSSDKSKKQAINKYYINKGTIGGVGSMYSGMVLLRNMESKFTTHAFSFDQTKAEMLKRPLADLLSERSSLEYKELKDLIQLYCAFPLFSEDANLQSEYAKDEVEALQRLHQRVCENITKQLTDLPKNPNFVHNGFCQKKYDNYLQSDVTKVTVTMNVVSLSEKVNDSVEIVLAGKDGQFTDLSSECKSVQDFIVLLRNKRMDLVVYIDSCSVKKTGRDVVLMPKLRVHQIILHEYVRKAHSTIGLKLNQA